MRDIDQVLKALQRRYPELRVEQPPATHDAWFIDLPATLIKVRLESSTGDCPFLIESSLSQERLHAASIGEAINMVSTILGSHSDNA